MCCFCARLQSHRTMGTRGLPDIYTLGPWALGVYIKLTLLQGCTHKMDVQYQFPLLFFNSR